MQFCTKGHTDMQNNKNNDLSHIRELSSRIYITLALAIMGISTLLCLFVPSIEPAICGAISIALYGIIALIVYFVFQRNLKIFDRKGQASEEQAQSVINAFREQLSLPYAVIDENGKIITSNSAFANAVGQRETVFNLTIDSLCGIDHNTVFISKKQTTDDEENDSSDDVAEVSSANTDNEPIEINGRKYNLECHPISTKGKRYTIVSFFDVTELSQITELYNNNIVAAGYISIDNLEEIAQYVRVSYQEETREVGKALKSWANRLGGILCEYENDKFLLLLTQEMLEICKKNKFAILNEIHKITLGDSHVHLTVSMGISTLGETLDEREHNAMIALDMAVQRGGDQVALKDKDNIHYFGAKTKATQKRLRGQAKIIYPKLASLIEDATNILVMGHKNPDFDCIGACVGITTLIKNLYNDIDVKIVTDVKNESFIACASRLAELDEYKDVFIDGVSALGYNSMGTLLIIVDANNFSILESPELAQTFFKKVIIDHHIKKEEFSEEPALVYIDPTASSACELIAEILEEALPFDTSFKEEASIMMSGIMLDTKNFTRTVGMRTFAAALYLKNAGADTEYARTFFEEGFDEYISEAQFGSAAKIYRDTIAITSVSDLGSANPRVLAAKAADKLLTIKNVNAAFALILIGNTVSISARSNGSINVQRIVEYLGGGGHFDMAGAAISDTTLDEAENMLKSAIDKYYESLESENDSEDYE